MLTEAEIAIEEIFFKKIVGRANIRQRKICLDFIVVPEQRKANRYYWQLLSMSSYFFAHIRGMLHVDEVKFTPA